MIYLIISLFILAPVAFLVFRRFTAAEVTLNAEDIKANGSQDNLRKAYHAKRVRVRVAWWLACTTGGTLPAWWLGRDPGALVFGALGLVLGGYFIRFFTPRLNLAMGLAYKPEYYCSSDSASWPDAAIWKKLRAANPTGDPRLLQAQANAAMRLLLVWTWRACLTAALALSAASLWLVLRG